MTIVEAYAACRTIARREAKNFYYAFRVLPRHKSDAMCAVYAFMRKADDISDDESLTIDERRRAMATWVTAWRAARSSEVSEDPVFLALNDTQRRFGISDELLEELVQGTTMDLEPSLVPAGKLQTFANFDDLYRYCYLVASVVGLVCIHIFGYSDKRAEKFAEETGIAFQLTNILRDVKEDAERHRIYLPLDLLQKFGTNPDRILATVEGAPIHGAERNALRSLAARAEMYYASAEKLLPLINRDSRAALWVLVNIYHNLLHRIEQRDGDVISKRVSVPTATKLAILARGMGMALRNRVMP
ncbi:MAG TPA: phytoene/squalene synthase family protein [Edaphobacter sp.]|nr:phytoene/squalene synthase family protein [Edaphobacter sp.]